MSEIGGVWRTIGGRRVFIKDGQDLASAMKESGKFTKNTETNTLKELKVKLKNAKGFLEKARIQNEITALEKGFSSYDEYEKNKQDQLAKKIAVKDTDGNQYTVDEAKLDKFVKNNNVNIDDWQKSDILLQEKYAKEIGYDSIMKIVTTDEYKNYDGIELSRVVAGKNKQDTDKIVINSQTGDIQYSNEAYSYYGKGLYYGDKKIESKLIKEYGNKNSAIINCKISKNAKILEVNDILDYIKTSNNLARGLKDSKLRDFYNTPAKNRNILFMNAEIDIIKVQRENYYIILNRGVLITNEK